MVGGGGFGDHGDLGAGIPVLEATLPRVDLLARDAYRLAAGKVGHSHPQPGIGAQRILRAFAAGLFAGGLGKRAIAGIAGIVGRARLGHSAPT